jgi:hypothetical protein
MYLSHFTVFRLWKTLFFSENVRQIADHKTITTIDNKTFIAYGSYVTLQKSNLNKKHFRRKQNELSQNKK